MEKGYSITSLCCLESTRLAYYDLTAVGQGSTCTVPVPNADILGEGHTRSSACIEMVAIEPRDQSQQNLGLGHAGACAVDGVWGMNVNLVAKIVMQGVARNEVYAGIHSLREPHIHTHSLSKNVSQHVTCGMVLASLGANLSPSRRQCG